jgi:molybdopterin-guanine dinucleotide biosynthesis protein A
MAGMLSAMNWNRSATWLFIACDLPCIEPEALQWLLSTRAPGVWATVPRLPDSKGVEPLLAHYDFRARYLLENLSRPCDIADEGKVITPEPPAEIQSAWQNINTPDDLDRLSEL